LRPEQRMSGRVGTTARIAVLLCVGNSLGCVTNNSYRAASSGPTGCPPSEITIRDRRGAMGAVSWVAECGAGVFTCSAVAQGGVSCAPLGGRTSQGSAAAPSASPTVGKSSKVARGFHEKTGVSYVRGDFELPQGVELRITGAPAVERGKIVLAVKGPAWSDVSACENMEVLVNARPSSARSQRRESTAPKFQLESDFDFEVFKPLARQYPEFAVRLCNRTWPLTAEQVEDLRKFFVLYADLAAEQAPAAGAATPASASPSP
jgi:hypothetical protein